MFGFLDLLLDSGLISYKFDILGAGWLPEQVTVRNGLVTWACCSRLWVRMQMGSWGSFFCAVWPVHMCTLSPSVWFSSY